MNLSTPKSNNPAILARYAALEARSQRVNQILFDSRMRQAETIQMTQDAEAMIQRVHRVSEAAAYFNEAKTTRPQARVESTN